MPDRASTTALSLIVVVGVMGILMAGVRASEAVSLVWPHRLSRTASALPRLRLADGAVADRINAALASADGRLRGAISQCAQDARDDGSGSSEWDRTVKVTMAGPEFLGLVATDSAFCGGAHPNFQTVALTFDLRNGRPVNWTALLHGPLVAGTTTEVAMDGTIMGLVRSKLLVGLGVDTSRACDMGDDAVFQFWPDADRHGVNFAWADPPHAEEDCGEPAVLDLRSLRGHHASVRLIQALAHAQTGNRHP